MNVPLVLRDIATAAGNTFCKIRDPATGETIS